jgi:hypothetical protein
MRLGVLIGIVLIAIAGFVGISKAGEIWGLGKTSASTSNDAISVDSDGDVTVGGKLTVVGTLVGGGITVTGLEIGTDVQAYDADLTTWATVTPSANGKSLVAGANYAAMRGLLDLEIGTDVQAYDADLTTWATVTPSANGKTLVAGASYAAMRGLLDLEIGTDVPAKGSYSGSLTIDSVTSITVVNGVITTWN